MPTEPPSLWSEVPLFCAQVGFSMVLASFSMYMIWSDRSPENTTVFLPILTGVAATWLPSPASSHGNRPGLLSTRASRPETGESTPESGARLTAPPAPVDDLPV